jgi:hypothetical protein
MADDESTLFLVEVPVVALDRVGGAAIAQG